MSRPVVVVSGALANKHKNGGEAWARLNWVLGLRRLGCNVLFVEQIRSEAGVDAAGAPVAFDRSANLRYFQSVVRRFELAQVASLVCDDGAQVYGVPMATILDVASRADVLINLSGHLTLAPILERIQRKAYVDLDPGFTQFWHAQGIAGARLEGHDFYITVGENIGTPDCVIPTCGLTWIHKPRFVVLEQWPVSTAGRTDRFTTVGAWRGPYGPVQHDGRTFGLKAHEFRKLLALPQRAAQTFELALQIHPADAADREALRLHGWELVRPDDVAADPEAFRRYVQHSGGECSAAQGMYVDTGSGWMSDRTVRYLASGKPCLVQDTGFSRNYPVGEGLVSFRTLDEAVAGAESIARDYRRHARAARRLAEDYFDSDLVLPRVLSQLGVGLRSEARQ